MRRFVFVLSMLLLTFDFTPNGLADSVRFKNGDVLTGKVMSLDKGKLVFKHSSLGSVTITVADINAINAETDMQIKLKDAEARVGRLVVQDDVMAFVANDGARVAATLDQLDTIATLESLSQNAAVGQQKFSGDVLIGISDIRGNSEISSVFLRGEAKLSEVMAGGNPDPLKMKADYSHSEEKGELSSRRGLGQLRYDNEIWNKTSLFFVEKVSFDEFRSLDLRAEEQIGLSRKLIVQPKYGVSADFGLTRIDSFFENALNQGGFGLVLGAHAHWNIIGSLAFTQDFTFRPTFEDFSDYLLDSETGLATKLSTNWNVKLLYQTFYDNDPPASVKNSDRNLILSFGHSF